MASWIGNRTTEIWRSKKDAEAEAKRLNKTGEFGWSYKVRPHANPRHFWFVIEVTDAAGAVLGVL
jgi:hypothetical protein